MAERNRVTPTGAIEAIDQRGLFLGNRGSIHRGHEVVRPWQVRRWITCALTTRAGGRRCGSRVGGRRCSSGTRPWPWPPGTDRAPCAATPTSPAGWTGGRRPPASGRRSTPSTGCSTTSGSAPTGASGCTRSPGPVSPTGTFALVDDTPHLVLGDRLVPWRPTADAYGAPIARPRTGRAIVLTPPSTVAVLAAGYEPVIHPH